MSVSYTAYIFIGAEVSEDHFWTEGKETYRCRTHGPKPKKFCDDCGRACNRSVEQLWTEDMVKAAKTMNKTPEELWDHLCPDGGRWFGDKKDRTFGLWTFDYEDKIPTWGICISSVGGDDHFGKKDSIVSLRAMAETISIVENNFKMYGIDKPVQIITCMSCG